MRKLILKEAKPTPIKMDFLPGDQVIVKTKEGDVPGVVIRQFPKVVRVMPDAGGKVLKVTPDKLTKK